jgi:hypothetical protein
MLVGMRNPLGTRNPHGYGFRQNFIPVIGMSFLADIFFLRGYRFGQVIPSEFLPVAISKFNTAVAFATERQPPSLVGVLPRRGSLYKERTRPRCSAHRPPLQQLPQRHQRAVLLVSLS